MGLIICLYIFFSDIYGFNVPPAVNPGEHVQGIIVDPDGNDVEVWHFQDDAVQGPVYIAINSPGTPEEYIYVDQPAPFAPKHYRPGYDGPTEIGEFSKDLAFALYTPVPEPSTILLLAVGLGCLLGWYRAKG